MKNFLAFAFFSFFVSLSLHADKAHSDTVSIINHMGNELFYIASYSDQFDDRELFMSNVSKEKQADFISQFPYLDIAISMPAELHFWLKKGEQYDIYSIETNEIPTKGKPFIFKYPILSHPNPELDNEVKLFLRLDSISNTTELKTRSEDFKDSCLQNNTYHLISQNLYKNQLDFLEKYKDKIPLQFYNLAKQRILSGYINRLCFAYEKQTEKKEEIKTSLLSFKSSIQNDELIFSSDYKNAVKSYNKFLTQIHTLSENPDISQLYNNAQKEFSGTTRDYLLFSLIKSNMGDNTISKTANEKLVSSFMKDCQSIDYKEYIQRLIKADELKILDKDILITTTLEKVPLNEVIERHKGKYIYIDFWASWCLPCRANMKHAHRWKEQFKDDIVFLYISLDKNLESWLRANQIENLDKENSFALPENGDFFKKFKSTGIPHYILINRNGKIIDTNAIRPIDENFEKQMNKLIKK